MGSKLRSVMSKLLFVAAARFGLPCAETCRFKKKCAEKFQDGECVPKIEEFTRKQIYGEPGIKSVKGDQIMFDTTNPEGKISISNGGASVER